MTPVSQQSLLDIECHIVLAFIMKTVVLPLFQKLGLIQSSWAMMTLRNALVSEV